jgi:hypothetical protein
VEIEILEYFFMHMEFLIAPSLYLDERTLGITESASLTPAPLEDLVCVRSKDETLQQICTHVGGKFPLQKLHPPGKVG